MFKVVVNVVIYIRNIIVVVFFTLRRHRRVPYYFNVVPVEFRCHRSFGNVVFRCSKITRDRRTDGRTDGPTDRRTDGRTDTTSYRDATAHLTRPDTRHKMRLACVLFTFENNAGQTDLRTDRRTDGPTDGRTDTTSYRDATAHLKRFLSMRPF